MKLVTKVTKTVDYFGIQLNVINSHKTIATDANGWVHSYEDSPKLEGFCWLSENDKYSFGTPVAVVDLDGLDWRETLKEI